MTALSIILSAIFFFLGSIHFFWAFGGNWGLEYALPTTTNNQKALRPSNLMTLFVGLVLFSFGWVFLSQTSIINLEKYNSTLNYIRWGISILFILRAIGDFNYVGFFKKVKPTKFSKADSQLFSPLCLIIGLVGIVLQLY